MTMCWKYLVPLSVLNLLGVAVWMALWPNDTRLGRGLTFLAGVALVVLFVRRVLFHLRRARMHLGFSPVLPGQGLIHEPR
jgi:hypothetical protein